jgi:general secretion pathway protein K
MALIVVLWLLVLLTVIASSHAQNIRVETRLATQQVDAARARALAEAGIYHAILELFVTDEAKRWPLNGTPVIIDLGGSRLTIVNLNAAQPALLRKLFAAVGVDDDRRVDLVDAVLDWRDRDTSRQLHGAEADDYRREGLAWSPRNGPFSSVEEFRYVLGMTSEVFARLAPYVTTYSGHQGVNPEFAPPWLAEVLSDAVERPSTALPPVLGRIAGSRTPVYHISVKARSPGGSIASMEVAAEIKANDDPPYRILAWREPGWPAPVDSE